MDRPLKILFIGPHRPNRNPSQRFRMEQYFPFLREAGFTCDYSWFINETDDRVFYSEGHVIGKAAIFLKAALVRFRDMFRTNDYDIIFIQREAFMTGSVFFEKEFSKSKAKVIFDFDDAIWLHDTSDSNKRLSWLKRPSKTSDIIALSDHVIAGNDYLASYAKKFNQNTTVIPTVVNTDIYLPLQKKHSRDASVTIGWTGSISTVKHFHALIPVLNDLKNSFGEKIKVVVIGDQSTSFKEPWIETKAWKASEEIMQLQELDIGLMPLPDDEWSKGKCGFKAIQYMGLAIPCVASPVGVNNTIIQHGQNGFLANTEEQWKQLLISLIENETLRYQLGWEGRKTIEAHYSLQSQLPRLVGVLRL
jgi:glycosyltransferase involved in cell wall biosynthesis